MIIHELKTWPEYFEEVFAGRKTFEVRQNDRGFNVGDQLFLREYDPETKCYTGRELTRTVTYILRGRDFTGIHDGTIVMAIK